MNVSNLADMSEIVGSIAVVITLIFLVIQMRENTRAIEASIRQAARDAEAQNLITSVDYPSVVLAWSKQDLSDEEVIQHNSWLIGFFRNRENDWFQYRRGVMDEATWERYISSMTGLFMSERNRNWWINYGATAYNPEFAEQVNNILEQTPSYKKPFQEFIRAWYLSPDECQRKLASLVAI